MVPDPARTDVTLDDLATHLNRPAECYARPLPAEADQMRTLGGIARLLGVDGKTITQYRGTIETRVHDRDQRGSRTLYRGTRSSTR